ncbi:MAG TPA: hypothetical protein PLI09_18235 [Candidatus Hydrogenedentes bacterium]|nr:hypothetical protein [Candidatus Hydrogenedentota bacterium]
MIHYTEMDKDTSQIFIHDRSAATVREQDLCRQALLSHEYDDMSDEEWILLCEKIAKDPPQGAFKDCGYCGK